MFRSCKPGSLFLAILDIFNRKSILLSVMPDIRNRASIWSSFRMDPRY